MASSSILGCIGAVRIQVKDRNGAARCQLKQDEDEVNLVDHKIRQINFLCRILFVGSDMVLAIS